ncbi:hypothetical protein OPT61_g49 [Boeremia exigua]|uniref:Uncharacterized protein n=1 Tax=Boeremia exigua TaxID=749465 RepID=A0ACC2IV50_9PLEO|nr:hypothetical protein OPT61_g49 [Boeremia exigua]
MASHYVWRRLYFDDYVFERQADTALEKLVIKGLMRERCRAGTSALARSGLIKHCLGEYKLSAGYVSSSGSTQQWRLDPEERKLIAKRANGAAKKSSAIMLMAKGLAQYFI